MKRPIFTDVDGSRYFQDAHGNIRDHRGQLLGLEHEANIRASLRTMTQPKLKTAAALRAQDTEFLRKPQHSMDDTSETAAEDFAPGAHGPGF